MASNTTTSREGALRHEPHLEDLELEEMEYDSDQDEDYDPSAAADDGDEEEEEVAFDVDSDMDGSFSSDLEDDEDYEEEEEEEEDLVEAGGVVGKESRVESDSPALPSCPICLGIWGSDGPHRVCCIPCGHVYGRSCLERWLRRCGNGTGKCPQCARTFKQKEIINLYAPSVAVPNDAVEKEMCLLREKCEYLQIEAPNQAMRQFEDLLEKNLQRLKQDLEQRLQQDLLVFEQRLQQEWDRWMQPFSSGIQCPQQHLGGAASSASTGAQFFASPQQDASPSVPRQH